MICEYGCEQVVNHYFTTVDKWCCSSHFSKINKGKPSSFKK